MANVTLVEVKETEGSKRKADKRHSKRHGRSSDGAGKKETVQVEAFDRGLDGSAVHGQDQDSTDVQERGQDSTSVQERGQDSTGVQERGQDGTRSHRRHHRGTGGHDRVQDGSGDNDRGQNDTRAHHRRNKGTGAHERSQSDTGAPPMGQDGADTQDMDTNETGMHGRGQNGTNTYERLTNTTIQEGVTQIDYSEHGEQFAEDVVDGTPRDPQGERPEDSITQQTHPSEDPNLATYCPDDNMAVCSPGILCAFILTYMTMCTFHAGWGRWLVC